MTSIMKGSGFDVGADFWRAREDTAIELAPCEHAKPGYVIGYICGDMGARVHLADLLGVNVRTMRRWVRGEHSIPDAVARAVWDLLEVRERADKAKMKQEMER